MTRSRSSGQWRAAGRGGEARALFWSGGDKRDLHSTSLELELSRPRAMFSAASLLHSLPLLAPRPSIRMFAAPTPLRRITSEADLEAVEIPDDDEALQLLMINRPDCKYAARMERDLQMRCEQDASLEGIIWTVEDDAEAEAIGAKRTPFCVAFSGGERTFDFVAQTPGAMHYGLIEVGKVVDATREQQLGRGMPSRAGQPVMQIDEPPVEGAMPLAEGEKPDLSAMSFDERLEYLASISPDVAAPVEEVEPNLFGFDKDNEETLWWSPKFLGLCLKDLTELTWPTPKNVAQTVVVSQIAFVIIFIAILVFDAFAEATVKSLIGHQPFVLRFDGSMSPSRGI